MLALGDSPEIKNMPKTENGFRFLPVPGSTGGFLKGYIAGLPGSFLFPCRGGSLIMHSSYVKMWASIERKMNLALTRRNSGNP